MAKKIEIDEKSWERQTITNRFMFYKIFTSDHELCRRLLEILLGLKISRIKMPEGEKSFESDAESHSIRVDIFTEDEKHIYDIEMQTTNDEDLPERARYYQGMMDVSTLKHSEPYSFLKDSIVIFICLSDPFGRKKARYIFRNLDTEDGKELGDRTSKIFFNAAMYDKIKDDEELRALLEYFFSGRAESGFTSSLEKQVGMARRNTEWRHGYMTMERMKYYAARRAAAQGMKQGLIKGAAKQKAEDEKILAKMAAQKDAMNAEIQRLMAKVAELENRK